MSLEQDTQRFTVETVRPLGDVVVRVSGGLDVYTVPELRRALDDVIDGQGNLSVVVDLEAMTFVDSTGVGLFITTCKRLRDKGGSLRLSAPSNGTRKVFEILGVDKVMEVTTF